MKVYPLSHMLKYIAKYKNIYYDGCILLSDLDKAYDVGCNVKILYHQKHDVLFMVEEDELKLFNTYRRSAVISENCVERNKSFPYNDAFIKFRSASRKYIDDYIDDLIKEKEFQDMNPIKENNACKIVGNYTIYKYRKPDHQLLRVNNSSVFYENKEDAYRAAQAMATNNPGEHFVVLQVDNAVTAVGVSWAR